jgi:hypothetical protein
MQPCIDAHHDDEPFRPAAAWRVTTAIGENKFDCTDCLLWRLVRLGFDRPITIARIRRPW